MDHGYGFTRIRVKPASPAPAYLAQLEALGPQAGEPIAIEAAIEKAGIKELPRMPDGRHIVSDLMSFYFYGSDANDLCYRAAIRRHDCRGLQGSEDAPPALREMAKKSGDTPAGADVSSGSDSSPGVSPDFLESV